MIRLFRHMDFAGCAPGGYWINPGAGNKDYWSFGAALWRQFGESLHLGIEVFEQTANVAGSKDGTGFNLGAIYDLSEKWHLLASAAVGNWPVSPPRANRQSHTSESPSALAPPAPPAPLCANTTPTGSVRFLPVNN